MDKKLYDPVTPRAYKLEKGERLLHSFDVYPWVFKTKNLIFKFEDFDMEGTCYLAHLTNQHFILEPERISAFSEIAGRILLSAIGAWIGSPAGQAWSYEKKQELKQVRSKLNAQGNFIAIPFEAIREFAVAEVKSTSIIEMVLNQDLKSEPFYFTAQPTGKGFFASLKGDPVEDFRKLANALVIETC